MSTIPAARLDHVDTRTTAQARAAAAQYVRAHCRDDVDLVLAMLGLEESHG